MKITINCPSYKRANKVITHKIMKDCKYYICESEEKEYLKYIDKKNIVIVPKGIQGNVGRIRNYILDHNQGIVVILDDDIKYISQFIVDGNFGYKRKQLNNDEIMELIYNKSIMCQDIGFKLWGLNLNEDKISYRHTEPIKTSNVVLGPFSVHVDSEIRYDENLPLKEDYDLSLQHLNKYRGILRFDNYHYKCYQSNIIGGCSLCRNREREKEQFLLLQKKWGKKIIRRDINNKSIKQKQYDDYNPIVRVPIGGI